MGANLIWSLLYCIWYSVFEEIADLELRIVIIYFSNF